ncbi:tail fiber domain-containing protein [Bdellovibrio bacteriovorus]|uniref:tail fiber domain-containing protein n=1 Tax=Bdellovibrio bacteriovorus TaxID=959 RepID=UPI0035A6495B
MKQAGTLLVLALFFYGGSVFAAPAALTYQGRIVKSSGVPLEYNAVAFQFEILAPNKVCVLYREQLNHVDMTNSNGVFDVKIGASHSYPLAPTFTILDAFSNGAALTCDGGSPYNPGLTDGRFLRVKFHDGAQWQTISPDNEIRSVPFSGFAASAATLGSHVSTDFVLKTEVNDNLNCSAGNFLTWDATTKKFGCAGVSGASGGTVQTVTASAGSSPYLSVSADTVNPEITLNVGTVAGTVAAGNDARFTNSRPPNGAAGGTLSGTYPNPGIATGAVQTAHIADAAISTAKLFSNPGVSRLVMTDSSTGDTLAPLSCAAGQLLTWNVTTGWQCTNASSLTVGSAATATTATSATTATTATNFTGSLAGDVSGTQSATSVDKIKGLPVDFSVAPTTGQFLKYDGAKWIPSSDNNAGGTITSLTGDVSASGSGAVAATVNSVGGSTAANINTATVAANAATNLNTASTIVKRDGSGNFSAGSVSVGSSIYRDSGSNTVTVQAPTTVTTSYVLKWPTAVGSANQVLGTDASGNLSWVTRLSTVNLSDIKATITPFGGVFANSACTSSQTLTYQSATDTFICQAISVGASNFASQAQNTVFAGPASGTGAPAFRALASADLPKTGADGVFVNGGNNFGAATSLGTTTATNLDIKTNDVSRISILSSGEVGIGTTPVANLHVNGAAIIGNGNTSFTNSSNWIFGASNSITNSAGGNAGAMNIVGSSNAISTTLYNFSYGLDVFGRSNTVSNAGNAYVAGRNNTVSAGNSVTIGSGITNSIASSLQIGASNTAKITILSSGNVGINTTAPSEVLEVNGNVKATAYLYTSDARLKKDVITLPEALEKLLKLRGVNFVWKNTNEKTVGFIAQEVEVVYPELVKTDKNSGYKAVQYGNIVAILVEALKEEHNQRVQAQAQCQRGIASVSAQSEERFEQLEKENQELKARLERLEKALLNGK